MSASRSIVSLLCTRWRICKLIRHPIVISREISQEKSVYMQVIDMRRQTIKSYTRFVQWTVIEARIVQLQYWSLRRFKRIQAHCYKSVREQGERAGEQKQCLLRVRMLIQLKFKLNTREIQSHLDCFYLITLAIIKCPARKFSR